MRGMASTMSHNPATRSDLPVPDDDMEISSDAGRGHADDNIDIDIDFDVPAAQTIDDDFMIEDDPSAEKMDPNIPHAVTSDSVMVDGDGNEQLLEHGMVEDGLEVQDEELLDVSDSEEQDTEIAETTGHDTTKAQEEDITQNLKPETVWEDGAPDPEQNESANDGPADPGDQLASTDRDEDEITYNLPTDEENTNDSLQDFQNKNTDNIQQKEEATTKTAPNDLPDIQRTLAPSDGPNTQGEAHETGPASDTIEVSASIPTNTHGDDPRAETDDEARPPQAKENSPNSTPDELEHIPEVSTQKPAEDVENGAADIGDDDNNRHYKSHPVVVLYEDAEIHLFPPAESGVSSTYFLNDETLVDAPLKDLLSEFRNVLGDSVTDNEELELEIGILGLSISENSSEATLSTLSTVLDVYGRLCQLDQILDVNGSPHPLHVVLRSKARFSARISQMYDLIEDGKGLSHLQFINSVAEELEQGPNEDDFPPEQEVEGNKGGDEEAEEEEEDADRLLYLDLNDTLTVESVDYNTSNLQSEVETIDYFPSADRTVHVARSSGNDPTDHPSSPLTRQESPSKDTRDDDLIDFGDVEEDEDEKDQPTTSTTPTLQGDDQLSLHVEGQIQNNNNRTSIEATQAEQQSEDKSGQPSIVGDLPEQTHEAGDDSLEQFDQFGEVSQADDFIESGETTHFDHHFELQEDGHGPYFGDTVDYNDDGSAHGIETFQTTEEQWENHDDEFVENHDSENHHFGDEEVDESEFLHDDEERDYLGAKDEAIEDGPNASRNHNPAEQVTSRKRSFAEHDEQGDGAEGDSKRSKPT